MHPGSVDVQAGDTVQHPRLGVDRLLELDLHL